MTYSLSKISSKADCDTLIASVQKEKSTLDFQQTSLEYQEEGFENGAATSIDKELAAVTTELNGVNSIITTLDAGKVKETYVKKQASLTLRQLILTEKKNNYGVTALIETEFELAQVAAQIAEADTLITALQARKAELPA